MPTVYLDSMPGPRPNAESNSYKQIIAEHTWATDGSRKIEKNDYPGPGG